MGPTIPTPIPTSSLSAAAYLRLRMQLNQVFTYEVSNNDDWKCRAYVYFDPARGICPAFEARQITHAQLRSAVEAAGAIGRGICGMYRPLERAGIRVGEVEAWRWWRVGNRNGAPTNWFEQNGPITRPTTELLCSMAFAWCVWTPGGIVASHCKPVPSNDYGIHAWKSPVNAGMYVRGDFCHVDDWHHVFGRVRLWGQIVEHEWGYRAEYAAISGLFEHEYSSAPQYMLDSLRNRYGLSSAPPSIPASLWTGR